MAQRYIDRFNTFARVLHWIVAVSFLILLFTGLGLFSKAFYAYLNFFGGPQQGILIHKWGGVVFFFSSVLLFLINAKDVCRFDKDDRTWVAKFGGYLTREEEPIPQGRYNAGQKMFALFSFLATLVMGATGLVIWDAAAFELNLTRFSLMLHSLFFILFIMGVVVHVYLGTIGNPHTLEGMLWGQVRKDWAKKHHSKWYKGIAKD